MHTVKVVLIALALIFSVPYLVWGMGRTEYRAPLVGGGVVRQPGRHPATAGGSPGADLVQRLRGPERPGPARTVSRFVGRRSDARTLAANAMVPSPKP